MNHTMIEQNLQYIQAKNKREYPILPVLLKLKRDGKAETTLISLSRNLDHLSRHIDIGNPIKVTSYISNLQVKNSYKNRLLNSYSHFIEFYKIEYKLHYYQKQSKLVNPPTTEQLQSLISASRYPLSLKLWVLMETGLRKIELCNLNTNDFNSQTQTLHPTTAKGGNPRILKLSDALTAQLTKYIKENKRQPTESLFNTTTKSLSNAYINLRKRTAIKLTQPELTKIRLHDFRHYYGTKLYQETKDILFVKQQMGHKSLNSTLIYTHILQFENNDNYTVKVATTIEQETELIEHGFTFVTNRDNIHIYKKRK